MLSASATNLLAICILATIGTALVVYTVVAVRRFPMTTPQTLLYAYNVLMTRVVWRARINGRLPIAPGQGAVIVCNHRSPVDPSFIEVATDRVVHWMVAKEYCQHPILGRMLKACEVIPVSRGGIDTSATKTAIRYAQDGELVGIFPEGRINVTDRVLLPGRPGAAMIALKARVPVVPCYVSGSPYNGTSWGSLVMAAKVNFTFGRPIDVSEFYDRHGDREVHQELTRRFMSEIARLAGQEDYQPELAGRFYKPGMARRESA